jgi:hypothetical protein
MMLARDGPGAVDLRRRVTMAFENGNYRRRAAVKNSGCREAAAIVRRSLP